jgi:Tol biopolymer transport system component
MISQEFGQGASGEIMRVEDQPMANHRIILTVGFMTLCTAAALVRGQGIPGSVAFYSARDGNNEIYVMDPDGSAPERITGNAASDVDPAISPDGRDIVFTSNRTGNNDIFVISSSGGTAVNVTKHPANDGWARWSPNGRHIVFHSNRDGNFEIYVMDADGGSLRRLTNYSGVDMYPDWSPEGRRIVIRRDADIYVMDLATPDEPQRLTETGPLLNQMAVWSPNGRRLAFMSAREGYPSVFVMNADGTGQQNLTPKDPGDADTDWVSRAPSWSTNGRQIYFMSSRPSTQLDTELFVMDPDGSDLRRLTYSLGVDGSPHAR